MKGRVNSIGHSSSVRKEGKDRVTPYFSKERPKDGLRLLSYGINYKKVEDQSKLKKEGWSLLV